MMNHNQKLSLNVVLIFFTIGLFFVIISPEFLIDGMCMDGIWYATLSKNLADGFSSFWLPRLTATEYAWGQPPLAFLLESPFFMLGNSLYLAKIYSVFTYFVTGFIMFLVWRETESNNNTFWMVLLAWVLVPIVDWSAPENLLENTMSIFVLLSVLMYLKSLKNHRFLYVVLSGLMLFLAFLTKGFTGLYPLAFPLIYWLFVRKTKLSNAVADTLLICVSLVLPILALYFFNPNANYYLKTYMNVQVLYSIKNVQTSGSRFDIVFSFIKDMKFHVVLVGMIILVALKQRVLRKSIGKINYRLALAFFVLVLCGVIPMMISMKQYHYYIVTVYPIFALAFGVVMAPILENIRTNLTFERLAKSISAIMLIIAVALNVHYTGKQGKYGDMLENFRLILAPIPENTTIGVSKGFGNEYTMIAYFYFQKKISIDSNENNTFYLCNQDENPPDNNYILCAKVDYFQLFRKME